MLIETLLQENVDLNILNREDQTTLMHNQLNSAKIYELVAQKIDLEAINALERSALHMTIKTYNFLMVEVLLECYIDISIRNKENDTTRSYLNKIKSFANINLRAQILQLLDKQKLKNK